MRKRQPVTPPQPIIWPRAEVAALAAFDPASKVCTMNCGSHRDDPRSQVERKLLCDECQCAHKKATMTVGPTTDQRNHYCADCGHSWTTWPTDAERRTQLVAELEYQSWQHVAGVASHVEASGGGGNRDA